MLWEALDGQTGTGPALEDARAAASRTSLASPSAATSTGGVGSPTALDCGPEPLQVERDAHRRASAAAVAAGRAPPPFEVWVLQSHPKDEPGSTSPNHGNVRRNNRPRRGSTSTSATSMTWD